MFVTMKDAWVHRDIKRTGNLRKEAKGRGCMVRASAASVTSTQKRLCLGICAWQGLAAWATKAPDALGAWCCFRLPSTEVMAVRITAATTRDELQLWRILRHAACNPSMQLHKQG
jgi:hypothetical protein